MGRFLRMEEMGGAGKVEIPHKRQIEPPPPPRGRVQEFVNVQWDALSGPHPPWFGLAPWVKKA